MPWLVAGLPETPELGAWGRWGVERVRALVSPTGVFGAYGACEDSVVWRDGALAFEGACGADPLCRPAHAAQELSLEAAAELWARAEAPVYLRAPASKEARLRVAGPLGLSGLLNLSAYQSARGCTTNLHWDSLPGVLAQTAGAKEVALFAPGTMPAEAPAGSPCARRSYHASECPAGAAVRVRLPAGLGLYIPAFWAHHVTSLSPVTLGSVWRLA